MKEMNILRQTRQHDGLSLSRRSILKALSASAAFVATAQVGAVAAELVPSDRAGKDPYPAAYPPAGIQPRRPANFKPVHFRYSTEELRDKFSAGEMKRAHKEMERVDRINASGAYQATWASLDTHRLPEWFEDAKFGMFIDWGPWSIPAYDPDWCMLDMYRRDKDYYEKVWGKDFTRYDFISLFTATEYDPQSMAKLAKASGMKYVIPFAKHHGGFPLWKSSYTFHNAADMGPKRDLIQPLAEAVRHQGLKFGFYFSLDEWEYPIIDEEGKLVVRMWSTSHNHKIYYTPYSSQEFDGKIPGKIPVRDFYNDYINPQAIEFIDMYDPDILWFDGDWMVGADERNSRSIIAYFYNHALGRKEVAVNDRAGSARFETIVGQAPDIPHGDFYVSENEFKFGRAPITRHNWELCSDIGSFGYNWQITKDASKSGRQVLEILVDVVSKGGNLLLMINPMGDGKLDPLMMDPLKTVGAWLTTNGEAIYATRTWKRFTQGDDIRFTESKNGVYLYAIALKWPGKSLVLNSVHAEPGSRLTMLGSADALNWHQQGDDLVIDLPDSPGRTEGQAWAFKIAQLRDQNALA